MHPIFVDVARIKLPRPANDHARAETYLSGFEHKLNMDYNLYCYSFCEAVGKL